MKQLLTFAAALLVSTYSFADINSTGFGKNSPQLKALGSAWKSSAQTTNLNNVKNDLTIVYGGEDVAPGRPTLVKSTITT